MAAAGTKKLLIALLILINILVLLNIRRSGPALPRGESHTAVYDTVGCCCCCCCLFCCYCCVEKARAPALFDDAAALQYHPSASVFQFLPQLHTLLPLVFLYY